MTPDRKPTVAFWITVALLAVLAYVGSIGPVAWAIRQPWCPLWFYWPVQIIYSPIIWLETNGPQWIRDSLSWYGHLWY